MDNATIELLIELVKGHPCLYDKEQSSRFNIDQKNQTWIEIANKLDKPVEKCKHKWRNLRDSYLKAIRSKHELGQIGQLALHRAYKYEDSMSFLEASSLKKRRSSTDGRSRRKRFKQENDFEQEYAEEQQEFTTTEDGEYLIENDRQTLEDGENSMDSTLRDEEVVTLEAEKEPETIEKDPEHIFVIPENHESTSIGLPYQEVFANETIAPVNLELDPWMAGIKETLMSLPKLMRAKAKRQINELVSEYEIKYLESLETERYGENYVANK